MVSLYRVHGGNVKSEWNGGGEAPVPEWRLARQELARQHAESIENAPDIPGLAS
jgi:hypothetical protein